MFLGFKIFLLYFGERAKQAYYTNQPDGSWKGCYHMRNSLSTGLYERTIAMKEQNPALKVLLAVGGWQIGSKPFIPMISSQTNMRMWIKNVITYLRK